MNTWIWRLVANGENLTYQHATKKFTFPKRMLVSVPKFITDSDIANLKAALLRDREKLHA